MYRGSRKHVLDWSSGPYFIPELLELAQPAPCRRTATSQWMPRGYDSPTEARLERFGPHTIPDHPAWGDITTWWLMHANGANTPNWDIALSCDIEGRPGLLLVEAKANVPELASAGKRDDSKASKNSKANHVRIGLAIAEARAELSAVLPGIAIDRDTHYQLSNRIAFAWRLASLGIPTVLLYLGFTGDEGIRVVGKPFADDEHWQRAFTKHLALVCPTTILDAPVDLGATKFWLLSRSRPVLESSPTKS